MEKSNSGCGFSTMLTIVFVALKVFGIVSWSCGDCCCGAVQGDC